MMLCTLLLLTVALQPPQPDPHVALELGRLKGAWRVVSVTENGTGKSSEDVRFRFNDNVLTVTDKAGEPLKGPDGKPVARRFVLDLAKSPKSIDLTLSSRFQTLGIYDLSGDELKLCTAEPGTPRPTEFKGRAGVALIVLKREAK